MVQRTDRRSVIKKGAAITAIGALAGCTGGGDGGDGGGDGGGASGGDDPDMDDDGGGEPTGPEAWRTETAEKARQELEDEKLVIWTGEETLQTLASEYDFGDIHDAYAPLTGNIQVQVANASELATKYARLQQRQDSVPVDFIAASLSRVYGQGARFEDVSDVPNYQALNDDWKIGNMIPWAGNGYFPMYNTDRVDEPPESFDDLFAERFHDEEIAIDFTPSIAPVWNCLYNEKSPKWLSRLADEQNLNLIKSLTTLSESIYKGDNKIAFYSVSSHIATGIIDELPIDFVRSEEMTIWQPRMAGVGKGAPHPNAAKLFADLLTDPDFHKTAFLEIVSGRYSMAAGDITPSELNDAWEGELWTLNQMDQTVEDATLAWQKAINAPTVQ